MTELSTNNQKFNPREEAVNKIIALLEKNPGAWKKTWETIGSTPKRPYNPITNTYYKGMNLFYLGLVAVDNQYSDNRWCTYNQAKNAGHPVLSGETSSAFVIYHQVNHIITILDKNHQIKSQPEIEVCQSISNIIIKYFPNQKKEIENILDSTIKGRNHIISKSETLVNELNKKLGTNISHQIRAVARHFPVFNFTQMDNVPTQETKQGHNWDPCERAEQILKSSGVPIYHDQYNKNYYRSGAHDIHLTIKSAFKTPEAYYATALHELAHAKINDGNLQLSFNPKEYSNSHIARAREELRAELSSIFICAEIGLNYDVQNHTAYLHSWLSLMKENKNEFWTATSESNRIADAIFICEREYISKLELSEQVPTNSAENKEIVKTLIVEPEIIPAEIIISNQNNDISR
jgi:antirestriction protein ArdC